MSTPNVFRVRGEGGTRVTAFELFFDLVFVFAVTQLSHRLLEHLTVAGAAETFLLLLAVWWGWMYTCWTTNWFDPDHLLIRLVLVGVMLASIMMSVGIPEAFDERGLFFAGGYVALQVGRTIWIAIFSRHHELGRNFQRILIWLAVSGAIWILGGTVHGSARVSLWVLAIAVDYLGPWAGYATPRLGRSRTDEWTIEGDHMAERCQLFVIIALGESLLVTAATFGDLKASAGNVVALVVAFTGTVAMWWIYFDRSARAAAEQIAASDDPGRLGRSAYTFIHLPMVAGIIVSAVGDELVIAHPGGHVAGGTAAVVLGGPALFVAGHALFKRAVFGHFTQARVLALVVLALLAVTYRLFTPLALAAAAAAVLLALVVWDARTLRATNGAKHPEPTQP